MEKINTSEVPPIKPKKKIPKDSLIISEIVSHLPESVLGNKELEDALRDTYSLIERSKDKADPIYEKVGIKERRSVRDEEGATDLAIKAGRKLLEKISLKPEDETLVAVATLSAEDRWPSIASQVLHHLNITEKFGHNDLSGFDIGAACTGWTYAVSLVEAYMLRQGYMNSIVISTDTMTRVVDPRDRSRILFGDAATAVLIEREKEESKGFRIINSATKLYPQSPADLRSPTKLSLTAKESEIDQFNINGEEVYRAGVGYTVKFIEQYLKKNNLTLENIDYIIPHQANGSMLERIAEELHLGKNKYGEDKLLSNIELRGNTAASSVPLCLYEFYKTGKFKNGDRLLLSSFGAGYTLGIVEVEVVL